MTIDVLPDPEIREAIKVYSQWPTIPQLYVDKEFIGGCDVVNEMFQQGELHEVLNLEMPPSTVPKIEFTEPARTALQQVLINEPGKALQLIIDAGWNPILAFGPIAGPTVTIDSSGIELHMDPTSAHRASGLKVDVEESLQGFRFKFDNPNAPPPVTQITPTALNDLLKRGDVVHLYDVRPLEERSVASIAMARPLEKLEEIESLDKEIKLIFHCQLGGRSQQIAERFRLLGFTNVFNLEGGIDRWSLEVDPGVRRY